MMSYIWLFFIATSILIAALNGKLPVLTSSVMNSSRLAVEVSFSLIGIMAFWLGIMKLAEKSGLIAIFANFIKPFAKKLFPEIPDDSPAIGNIAMNFSANALGLSNAATPLGIKAMKNLQDLNKSKVASNSMCTFLTINTAGFQLIPATVIAILASSGCDNPMSIIGPCMFATIIAMVVGLFSVKFLEKLSYFSVKKHNYSPEEQEVTK